MKKLLTLCIIHEHPRVLLGMKKRGFGEGRWNGFGGKVEEGESVEESMRRELMEEAGIEAGKLERAGVMELHYPAEEKTWEVHVFRGMDLVNKPEESEEMRPAWFYIDEIPFEKMWPDDLYWFPYFLRGEEFTGSFHFDEKNRLLSAKVDKV